MRIPVAKPYIGEKELEYVTQAIRTGWISSRGDFVQRFEALLASFIGSKYGIACSSGTAALHLALLALGVGPGDEVIVPSLTYVASANAISYCGATPVFADVDPETWCISLEEVEKNISPRTKAVMPVHLYGNVCEMDQLMELARAKGIYVIEDCAEAHGALYKERRAGSFGDISCFSFFGNKIITTGEGGMCITDSEEYARCVRYYCDQCASPDKRYWHNQIGYNYRLTNLQAAVGVAQLERVEDTLQKKQEIAKSYNEVLKPLEKRGLVRLQKVREGVFSAHWMYTLVIESDSGFSRDDFIVEMDKRGVETRPAFYPLHTLPPYRTRIRLKNSEFISAHGVSLPSGPDISDEELSYVCQAIEDILT
ncbi:DegT/DnrJ/EryC1/StrS family aminotransferase [Candidatus Solincola sp.]